MSSILFEDFVCQCGKTFIGHPSKVSMLIKLHKKKCKVCVVYEPVRTDIITDLGRPKSHNGEIAKQLIKNKGKNEIVPDLHINKKVV
jgi:hypothetical protein